MNYNPTYRQKDNGWQVIISYKDASGKWRQKSKQGFETKKKAKVGGEVIIEKLKEESALNTPVDLIDITFEEYTDKFLLYVEKSFEYSTLILYRKALKNFKDLNKLKVADINKMHIEGCIFKMADNLSPVTQHARLQCIKAMFNKAVDDYHIISKSPAIGVKIKKTKKKDHKTILSSIQLDDFLKQMNDLSFSHYVYALIAAHSGLRKGETSALIWADIDFINNTISVNKQLKESPNGKVIGELKSKNSYRAVPMSKLLNKELRRYKKNSVIDINGRLFPEDAYYNQIHYRMNKTTYKLRYHDLRHTYATLLLANGVDIRTVAALLGDTIQVVMDTYIHFTDEMRLNAKSSIANIF